MGAVLSHRCSDPPWTRVSFAPEREVAPLTSLDQLLDYKDQILCAVEPLRETIRRGRPQDPKTLFCHDMMGGYREDRHVYGCEASDPYRFHHWQNINTFVYYTHNLVTIPPHGWISAAHRHGVKVLGTFMLESFIGLTTINDIEERGILSQAAAQLALVASLGKFDGWLVSVGCDVADSYVQFLKDLLAAITAETHNAVPGSLVIWYDSIDEIGMANPQNELNEQNSSFFDLCDGIFLNFHWTEDMLQKSAQLAGSRKADVYVGVDVFARDTKYRGGFEMSQAVRTARSHGLSAAIFGAGWVYETQTMYHFAKNQYRLWDFPDDICPEWRLTSPPLFTNFCQGFGYQYFYAGEAVSYRTWFNLSKQQLQPRDQGDGLCSGCGSATVYLDDAYKRGGCLSLKFKTCGSQPYAVPYFRLFGCDFPLGSLTISYTFKNSGIFVKAGSDVALLLKVRTPAGETEELSLGLRTSQPDEGNYVLRPESVGTPDAASNSPAAEWTTRKYYAEDKRGADGSTLDEIGIRLIGASAGTMRCLLGELDVKRPTDSSAAAPPDAAVAGTSKDDGYEPKKKRRRIARPKGTVATSRTTE